MTQNARKMMKTLKSIRKQMQKQDRKKQNIMKETTEDKNHGRTVKKNSHMRETARNEEE